MTMTTIRIKGLAGLANKVRLDLSGVVTTERRDEIQTNVCEAIQSVDQILADDDAKVDDLPPQSRKAYQFLASLDFRAIQTTESPEAAAPTAGSVRFTGLKSHFEAVLDRLAIAEASQLDSICNEIRSLSAHIEEDIAQDDIQPDQLTANTRAIRGWLAFFADPDNCTAYAEALARAKGAIEPHIQRSPRLHIPALIHLRPMKGVYRLRGFRDGTRVSLPTPMISFDDQAFELLAGLALDDQSNKQAVVQELTSEACQSVQAELESLGGIVERSAGMVHDLTESFARVNKAYFNGTMPRPHLTWNSIFTHRKFGHYDCVRDTLMVSSSLDQASVPAFVVDFIVYHELLHKQLGIRWRNGRARAHTPEFKRQERKFAQYEEAERHLRYD